MSETASASRASAPELRQAIVKGTTWSALGIVAFAIFTVCFVAIPLTAPLYLWTDLDTYLAYRREFAQVFQHAAMLAMLLFGPLVVILPSSIHDYPREEVKPLARISVCVGGACGGWPEESGDSPMRRDRDAPMLVTGERPAAAAVRSGARWRGMRWNSRNW